MPFSNPVVGGTTLIRPAIHSPDYAAGVSGWSVNKDGSAEFNDLTVRGDGGDTVIIGPSTGPQVIIGSNAGGGYIRIPTNRPIEDDPTLFAAAIVNSGAADEYAMMQIQGPSVDGANDRILFNLTSQANDGSRDALFWVRLDDGTGTFPTLFQMSKIFTLLNKTRLAITPDASASAALFVNPAVGHTGELLRLQNGGTDRFVVDSAGTVSTVFKASNRVTGTVTITPSAPNVPTSQAVVFPTPLTGTTFTCQVTPLTLAPATQVTGWSYSSLSSTGVTITLTRTNTSATPLSYTVEGF